MRTLLSDRFAPITSTIGFLETPLEEAADALVAWRRKLYGRAEAVELHAPLSEILPRLEPLTAGARPRELLVATISSWTAYFDCGLNGGDPRSPVGHLCRVLGCRGLIVASIPNTYGMADETPGRYGAVQFELLGPDDSNALGYVRSLGIVNDGGRWTFDAIGTVQDFEQPEAYGRRRKRDRFTSDMLAEYSAALGLRPLDEKFYAARAVLVASEQPVPAGGRQATLAEAQARLGVVPGVADDRPG